MKFEIHSFTLLLQHKVYISLNTNPRDSSSVNIGHSSVVYDDKMWVMAGDSDDYKNDIWYSADGTTWTQATSSASFSARAYHSSVVYDNKMWVIEGFYYNSASFKNDVWYSTDGATWTQATSSASFSARQFHSTIVFDNKMWIIGGFDGSGNRKNDIWYSN